MVKIKLTTNEIVYVEGGPREIIKQLQDAGKHYVEVESVKPRRKSVWINPCHVINVTAEFSD